MTTKNAQDILTMLQSLAQYEIDGSFIISQAMGSLTDTHVIERLSQIRETCEQNISELGELIRQYGKDAPEHSRDFKGFFMQGYVGMRGLISDKGVMKALQANLQIVEKAYEKALDTDDLPGDIRDKLQGLLQKVSSHLQYVASHL